MNRLPNPIRDFVLRESPKAIENLRQDITQRISGIEEFNFSPKDFQLFKDKLPTLTQACGQIGKETIGKIVVKRMGAGIHIILCCAFAKDHVALTFNEDKSNNVTVYFARITPHSTEQMFELKPIKNELDRLRIIQEAVQFIEETHPPIL